MGRFEHLDEEKKMTLKDIIAFTSVAGITSHLLGSLYVAASYDHISFLEALNCDMTRNITLGYMITTFLITAGIAAHQDLHYY